VSKIPARPLGRRRRSRTIAFFENSRGTGASLLFAVFLLAGVASFLAAGFGAALGAFLLAGLINLLGGFLGFGCALLLAGSLLRCGLLRRDGRALFRNGGGFGGGGDFCVLHGGVYPFGG
jgi:hypothetical protein